MSDEKLLEALAQLEPPADSRLLDETMLGISGKLDAFVKQHGTLKGEAQRLLEEFTSKPSPITQNRGGSFSLPSVAREHGSIFELLSGLYLPADDPSVLAPADRRYFDDEITTGAVGSASANRRNGKLITVQSVDLHATQESTWAGVYILFRTDLARYGQVSRVTFEPNIEWTFRDILDSNPVWLDRVAHLDGTVQFTARIWLTGHEYNVATNKFDPIAPPSAARFEAWRSTWYVSSLGESAMSGSLKNGAATFRFIVSPARTYALGVVIELNASHNLRNVAGGSIPKPQSGDFTQYALFKAEVPEMWLSHQVLAR